LPNAGDEALSIMAHDSLGPRLRLHPSYANIGMYRRMKNLTRLADSRSNVKSFPTGVQDDIGYALYAAQLGELSVKAKPLHGLGGQVMEIAAHDASGTYRAVYTVSIGESIYVIHAFQKKSKARIATPKPEMDLVRQRLKQFEKRGEECRKERPLSRSPVRATYSPTSASPTPANT
jgi:phage-related protein